MTEKECPDAIQVAADAFYKAMGGEDYTKTSTGAVRDNTFSLMTDYTNRLTAEVNAAGPNADVAKMAIDVFQQMLPPGNYQQLSNGAIADVNFSLLTEFNNNLNAGLNSAAICKALHRT